MRMTKEFLFKDTESSLRVKIKMTLEDYEQGRPVFSARGALYAKYQKDCYSCGQCLDRIEVMQLANKSPLLAEILRLHSLYHLNDMHAGTQEQEAFLKGCTDEMRVKAFEKLSEDERLTACYDSYAINCLLLEQAGLYEVQFNGKPYQYGHGWIYQPMPEQDLQSIKNILSLKKTEYKL